MDKVWVVISLYEDADGGLTTNIIKVWGNQNSAIRQRDSLNKMREPFVEYEYEEVDFSA